MSLTTKSGRKILLNTPEEEAAINAGIAADPDTFEPSPEEFKLFKRVGRPVSSNPKRHTNLRLSPEVVDTFRATGKGWQTRIDDALKDWLKTHSAA